MRDGGQADDLEAMTLSSLGQLREVTGTFCTEAEVIADDQPLHVQAVDQHVLNETLRRQRSKAGAEVLDDHAVDAALF
mgnify:CR=1 FL=1